MKYIIEIEDEPLTRQSALYGETAVYRAKGFKSLVFDEEGLSNLTPMPDSERIKEGAEAMTNEKAIELLDNLIGMVDDSHENDYDEAFRMAIKAIEQLATNLQPSCNQVATDSISRQGAIDALLGELAYKEDIREYGLDRYDVETVLKALPSAERKKGRWIDEGQYGDNFPHHAWRCSECGEGVIEVDTPWFKFCPNCGADMRGEQDALN